MKKLYKNVLFSFIILYFVITLITQQKKINQYKTEAAAYTQQLETAEQTHEDLLNIKSNLNSPEYIEEVAREKLNMYLPNERVYIDMEK